MNKAKLSAGAVRALTMLREGDLTVAEIKSKGFESVNSAHLTALVNRELVSTQTVQLVCETCGSKRKVNRYSLTEKGQEYKGE